MKRPHPPRLAFLDDYLCRRVRFRVKVYKRAVSKIDPQTESLLVDVLDLLSDHLAKRSHTFYLRSYHAPNCITSATTLQE